MTEEQIVNEELDGLNYGIVEKFLYGSYGDFPGRVPRHIRVKELRGFMAKIRDGNRLEYEKIREYCNNQSWQQRFPTWKSNVEMDNSDIFVDLPTQTIPVVEINFGNVVLT